MHIRDGPLVFWAMWTVFFLMGKNICCHIYVDAHAYERPAIYAPTYAFSHNVTDIAKLNHI